MSESAIDKIILYLKEKKILIYGLGREGLASLDFISKHFNELSLKKLAVLDSNMDNYDKVPELPNIIFESNNENITDILRRYDICIKSPGISFAHLRRLDDNIQYLEDAKDCEITCQTDLFLRFSDMPKIAITGTKGKSTTTSLIHHLLSFNSLPSHLLGNIGIPVFNEIHSGKEEIASIELSCHQLEFSKASANISILTNLYPEHLDHYPDYDSYCLAKLNIAKFQNYDDFFIFRSDDSKILNKISELSNRFSDFKAVKVIFSNNREALSSDYLSKFGLDDTHRIVKILLNSNKLYIDYTEDIETNLKKFNSRGTAFLSEYKIEQANNCKGEHMLMNAAMASFVAIMFGLTQTEILSGLSSFESLSHRYEYVGRFDGIDFINDSIATIPQASKLAVENCANAACLIIGGQDRGIDYSLFQTICKNYKLRHIFCIPDAGWRIMKELLDTGEYLLSEYSYDKTRPLRFKIEVNNQNKLSPTSIKSKSILEALDGPLCLYAVNNMEEAVDLCFELCPKGSACILSPAAASYNHYKNFEERGDHFKALIKNNNPMYKRALILINPESGRGLSDADLASIVNILSKHNILATININQYSRQLSDIVANKIDDFDFISCYGGDGTMKDLATALTNMKSDKPALYLPGGSTCDFAKNIGISNNLEQSLSLFWDGEYAKADIGLANGEAFVYIASFGAFADTSYSTSRELKKNLGSLAYFIEALKSVGKIAPIHCKVKNSEIDLEDNYLFVSVSNSISVGGILNFESENIYMDDSYFELLLIKASDNHFLYPGLIAKLLLNDYDHELIERYKVKSVDFFFDEPVAFTLDGEFARQSKSWHIEVKNKAYSIMVPPNNPYFKDSH